MSSSEDDATGNVWSWEPQTNPSSSLLRNRSSSPIDFFIYDDIISKQRLERLIKACGGSVSNDVVGTCTIILVNECLKPPEAWGPCYSRKFIRDCIESSAFLELSDYLMPGCVFNGFQGKITYYLYNEMFKFRREPFPTTFYDKDSQMSAEEVNSFYRESPDLLPEDPCCSHNLNLEPEPLTLILDDNSRWKLKGFFCQCRKEFKVHEGLNKKARLTCNCSSLNAENTSKSDMPPAEKVILNNLKEIENRPVNGDSRIVQVAERDIGMPPESHVQHKIRDQDESNNEDGLSLLVSFHGIRPVKKNNKSSLSKVKDVKTGIEELNCSAPQPSTSKENKENGLSTTKSIEARKTQNADSESDEDFALPSTTERLKPFIFASKHTKTKFSLKEKAAILRYIVAKNAYGRLKSDALFREMESKNICPKRTYQSMKNHFLKYLLEELDSFDFLDEDTKRKLRGEW